MNLNLARYVDKWVGLPICLAFFALERLTRPWTGRPIASLLATTPPDGTPPVPPRRILCMKFYGLGNMVILLPVLAALRQRYPEVEIDFMTMPGNTSLLERSGLVTRTIPVETSRLGRFLASFFQALRVVRSRRYDTVLDFEQFVKISCIIGFLSGARRRIGFNTDGHRRGFTYTTRVVYTDSDHMTAIFARLLRPLGITEVAPAPTWRHDPAEQAKVDAFLREHAVGSTAFPIVVMHLGIGMNFYRVPLKRWDTANFAAVAEALSTHRGATVVFTGQGPDERQLVAEARRTVRAATLDACDRFSVTELTALLASSDLLFVL
jgi:ADP-heptose:LPS heptosyltransferase